MECLYCKLLYSGGSNRILHHLAGSGGSFGVSACQSVSPELRQKLTSRIEQQKQDQPRKNKLKHLSRTSSSSEDVEVVGPPAKKQKDGNIKSMLGKSQKHDVDRAVARYLYATGTPFNRLASPYFDEMLAAVATYGPGYRKPSVKAVREACWRRNSKVCKTASRRPFWLACPTRVAP